MTLTLAKCSIRRNGLTLNTVIQGAWSILLGRYGGRRDIVFGVTSSGRPADLESAEEHTAS